MSPPPTLTGTFDDSPWRGRDSLAATQLAASWEAPVDIAPEHPPRSFGCFERAVSERHDGGQGPGLYMTWRLVGALVGTMHVESKPGAGTSFAVELPLRPPAEGAPW